MIGRKVWRSLQGFANKAANFLWTADPIAQMQYEYDLAVVQLKEGREGLEQYRALVERVWRQIANERTHIRDLESKVRAYLAANDRETAGRFALELRKAQEELAENEEQVQLHEAAYENNLAKIKQAGAKLSQVREQIAKYDAELKMTKAEAEMAKLTTSFNIDATTDFGQIEQFVHDKISLNKAKVRVAGDLSGEGADDRERQRAMERALADQALRDFEAGARIGAAPAARPTEPPKQLAPPAAGPSNE
ncbi:MAG TPA: PspA/IM30 family protein [Pirellulales bacterium]|nr:PspA/IM30 family protein [Pirellulales bacterium]